jgi:hypothetical protein
MDGRRREIQRHGATTMSQLSKSLRQKVLERDGHECQFCGVTNDQHERDYDRGLEVHHVVPQRAAGEDRRENLITVCRSCHNTLEHTQSDALQRIKEAETPDEVEDLKQSNSELQDENARLKEELRVERQTSGRLISTIHGLERLLRDESFIAEKLNGQSVLVEVVTEHWGREALVTDDSSEAVSAYEEWGDRIDKQSVKISDGDKLAGSLVQEYDYEREYR